MSGPFDFLHIKNRTAGSSNELSFDVLDLASRDAADKKERSSKSAVASGVTPAGSPAVADFSTLSNLPEVTARKRARRNRAARSWIIVIVAVVALVGTGVFMGYRFYQDKQDFSTRFNQLIDRFIEVDRTMVEVDALMVDPLSSVENVARAEVVERFASINRELNAVVAVSKEMEQLAQSDHDRSALAEIEDAANARSDMMAAAEDAFNLSKRANQLADTAAKAWSEVLEGDALAREATNQANSAKTEDATIAAQEKTAQARNLMVAARQELALVEKEERGIDLSAETAYIDKRIEALDAALATADALLANDRAAARTANDEYNAADKQAAALAEKLPSSLSTQVKSAFQDDLEEILGSYNHAREAVASADSALRAYL